ncbi:MAG: CPBP family intramembrane metalloprotease [Candidatus Marinimicrobia bacterium]|nr:CPBP family intramembrane metalloprotease [Candidatus Neomarinimicrobiota bacterium]
MKLLKNYFKNSRSPLYSLILIAPLLVVYEFLLFRLNKSDIEGIRNGADVLVRRIFHYFNIYGFYLVGFIIFVSIFLAYYYRIKKEKSIKIHFNFFPLMIAESCIYALGLLLLLQKSGSILVKPIILNTKYQLFIMALGAGIYEELVFRVIMISAGIFFFNKLLRWNITTSKILSIICAALLFSLFHYIGPLGDSFQMKSFLLRSMAGLLLSIIYIFRGYGITAYTHTIYDLIIIFF